MSKKTEKALNEKLNVKLPENLSKDNMLEQLQNVQQSEKIVEMPKKKNTAKRIIPIAASFAVIIGLLSAYFGLGLGDKTNNPQYSSDNSFGSDKTEVVRYQSYDKIYDKFDALRKEYKKDSFNYLIDGVFNDVFTTVTDDAGEDNMAGDMNTGQSASSGSVRPESAPETETTNKDFGTTNRQEEDVDEGDVIKTDGNYLYIAKSGYISIIDVRDKEMKELSQIALQDKEFCEEIYVVGNRLVVLGYAYNKFEKNNEKEDEYYGYYYYGAGSTMVKVYDITDRTAPKLVMEYNQQGKYSNSRMIGTKLYAISTYYVYVGDIDYRDYCIPETEVNGVCEKIPADSISVIEESESSTYAVISTLDVASDTEPHCEAILGRCNNLYASSNGLFISETAHDEQTYEKITKIYRFEYTAIGVTYKCMGKVAGSINNQFSMSYDGEYFRIATTNNKYFTYDAEGKATEVQVFDKDGKWNKELDDIEVSNITMNNLYVLNNNMQIVGKVEDLAKGETIQSVRFVGNMAYVVTFRQTDPLFVIDLSNPESPTVKGELKIPGFSEYLHPIADGLLVGVGYDGNEDGTNGNGKVSLFDVSNPYEPKESSVCIVSERNCFCNSLVGYNHKLYINLSETEFAVPFIFYEYINTNGNEGAYYIRYKFENGELYEVARYNLGEETYKIWGATYVENTFYAVANSYDIGFFVVAFDLVTNEEIGRLSIKNRGE